MGKHLTAPVPSKGMPRGIPYIIANEAAERFSFYGMKAVLTIFMASYLHLMGKQAMEPMPDARAEEYYHLFTAAVYATPFLGALIADLFFGKYRTIISLSLVYCAGHAALAFMGVAGPPAWWLLAGLGLISLGSGGIKPCVSAHVGDQFGKSNAHLLTTVFFWFYFSINLGAFASTLLTPWLLEWYGPHWAFGVPGVLMALATVMFWMGRNAFVHIPPDGAGFARELFSANGIRTVASLFVVYIFVAVFWALFDQTGSSWVLQARDLDRNVLGFEILPSQVQAANPLLILTLIPIFSFLIYPRVDRIWKLTPIRKIGSGLFVMVIAFALVAWVQERIDAGETPSIGWQIFAYLLLTASEVMVSITALEFSYTQAPRKMKSVVMAFFLWSVTLGNFFTAGVNNYVQVPSGTVELSDVGTQANAWLLERLDDESAAESARGDGAAGRAASDAVSDAASDAAADARVDRVVQVPTAADLELDEALRYTADDAGFRVRAAGHDGQFDTSDDIEVVFVANQKGNGFDRSDVVTQGLAETRAAAEIVLESWRASGRLPRTEEGALLLAGRTDPWGEPLIYTLQNRLQFRVASRGPDREIETQWDVGHVVEVDDLTSADTSDEPRRQTWLERRRAELGLLDETRGEDTDSTVSPFVGGQSRLEGANFFWFFTLVMLGAALLFIPVGLVYKPREYLQEEAAPTLPNVDADAGR